MLPTWQGGGSHLSGAGLDWSMLRWACRRLRWLGWRADLSPWVDFIRRSHWFW